MKHIYLNLKRFDIPKEYGGINTIASAKEWGNFIVLRTQNKLKQFSNVEFSMFFPEAHIIQALNSCTLESPLKIGCQSVYRNDVSIGGNFGAFTSNRTAKGMAALGCTTVLIGHCEERNDLNGILREAGIIDPDAVNRILNQEIRCAVAAGLGVLYCIGENSEEKAGWKEVLKKQLAIGLDDVNTSQIVIGYEPVWSIGPGKVPADKDYITKVARYVKQNTNGMDVVYGGGLKKENANMLASIDEIDGGLIALTQFSGEIGFFPDQYIEIIQTYLGE